MVEEKLLTVREVANLLNITEKEVIEFVERGELSAYKVADAYLRFRRQDVESFKKERLKLGQSILPPKISFKERFIDFLYFNDFYILSFILIILLIFIILLKI